MVLTEMLLKKYNMITHCSLLLKMNMNYIRLASLRKQTPERMNAEALFYRDEGREEEDAGVARRQDYGHPKLN